MAENTNIVTKDSSLKRYFKFMLTNRKMSVQFTSGKIRQIIETDLGIKLDPPQSLYASVCVEAFAYYMQTWPEWNVAIKSSYSDALYNCLVKYLRNKLLYLKKREEVSKQMNKVQYSVPLPEQNKSINASNNDKQMIKAPYSLKVCVPNYLWNTNRIRFLNHESNLYLEFDRLRKFEYDFGIKELINHPLVSCQFSLPNLITITRSSPFCVDRYLQSINSEISYTHAREDFTTSIYGEITANSKVYTANVMQKLFSKLKDVMNSFGPKINEAHKHQISVICDTFLADILESNVNETTVCEGCIVAYNIGKTKYVVDSPTKVINDNNEELVYRKIMTPIVWYSLSNCSITTQNITPDGNFRYFDSVLDLRCDFLQRLKSSIEYKCLACNITLTLSNLKLHFRDLHPLDQMLQCIKCLQSYPTGRLVIKRWRHNCVKK